MKIKLTAVNVLEKHYPLAILEIDKWAQSFVADIEKLVEQETEALKQENEQLKFQLRQKLIS